MIAIPLPFVIALLLSMLAALLFFRREESTQAAFVFITLCVLTTIVVGLRWTFDYSLFRFFQPILASCIPAAAWYCFSSAHKSYMPRSYYLKLRHYLPPAFMVSSSFTYSLWRPPIDLILTSLYVCYGVALIRASFKTSELPEQVRFSDMNMALKAQCMAGGVLLMSASIDGAFAIDFAFFEGRHALTILTVGHTALLPILAISVVIISLSVAPTSTKEEEEVQIQYRPAKAEEKGKTVQQLTADEVKEIAEKVDTLLISKEVFLDPDLTLDRLARKIGIPARQISNAINQVYGRNISQVVNEYRIERAKTLLRTSDRTITQIYLDSGFQTKSNFHREFSRITQQTPSAFRRAQ